MKDILKNEDVEMLLMSKSMPLSKIIQTIGEEGNSPYVTIIQNTEDGCNVRIGIQPSKNFQQILFSGLMAINNIMDQDLVDQLNKPPRAKEVVEEIDLDKETMELLQQLYKKLKKRTGKKLFADVHAEQMLLGAVLINNDLIERIDYFLKADHFSEKLHQKIYRAIEILVEKGLSATPVTIKSMLEKDPLYQELNGNEYIIRLTTIAMVVINPYDYGQIIYDLAIKRFGIDELRNSHNEEEV